MNYLKLLKDDFIPNNYVTTAGAMFYYISTYPLKNAGLLFKKEIHSYDCIYFYKDSTFLTIHHFIDNKTHYEKIRLTLLKSRLQSEFFTKNIQNNQLNLF